METTLSRYVSYRLTWKELIDAHPEYKCFPPSILAHHLSLVCNVGIGRHRLSTLKTKGSLTIRRKIKQALNVADEKLFLDIYQELFTHKKDFGKFVRASNGIAYFNMGNERLTEREIVDAMQPEEWTSKVLRNDIRISKVMKGEKESLKVEYRGKQGVQISTGIVHGYCHKLFTQGGEANTGQRKGVNTRLWFNIVNARDILQIVSLQLWIMILDGNPLVSTGRYSVDSMTNKRSDRLANYLCGACKLQFFSSLEVIQRDDEGKVKHKGTDKGKYSPEGIYKRAILKPYQFGSLSELRENANGTFKLLEAYGENELS
jgi:hypothetical protein